MFLNEYKDPQKYINDAAKLQMLHTCLSGDASLRNKPRP